MEDLIRQIGIRIFERRKQLRLTQEELAELASITPQTVSSAELGKKALRPENIIKICVALNISTDYLLFGKITEVDNYYLFSRMSILSPKEYRRLEEIITNFIDALYDNPRLNWFLILPPETNIVHRY